MIDRDAIRQHIVEVREYDAKATPGDWEKGVGPYHRVVVNSPHKKYPVVDTCGREDAEAICAFRSLAPALTEDAEGLLQENEHVKSLIIRLRVLVDQLCEELPVETVTRLCDGFWDAEDAATLNERDQLRQALADLITECHGKQREPGWDVDAELADLRKRTR